MAGSRPGQIIDAIPSWRHSPESRRTRYSGVSRDEEDVVSMDVLNQVDVQRGWQRVRNPDGLVPEGNNRPGQGSNGPVFGAPPDQYQNTVQELDGEHICGVMGDGCGGRKTAQAQALARQGGGAPGPTLREVV